MLRSHPSSPLGRLTSYHSSASPLTLPFSSFQQTDQTLDPEPEPDPDPDPDPDLSRAIARLINAHHPTSWSSDLESALSSLSTRLTQPSLLRALDLIKPPSAALLLFQWAHRRLPLDDRAFSKMLHVLSRSRKNLAPARDFLLSLPSHSVPLHDRFFNTLIRAHSRAGLLRESVSLFRLMASLRVPPSVFSFNALLSALLRRGRTHSAAKLYREMVRPSEGCNAVSPDVCTFNILIRGFCLSKMVDEGFRFFQEMSRRGCKPDIVTYNTLLDGLCRAGKIQIAHNLFEGMRTKGPDLAPNVVSFTTLIRGYCGKQRVTEAVGLFEEMVGFGLKPNKITYNTLIQGLCEARRMDLVKDILERAVYGSSDAGFRPDTCTFNTLMAAHCNAGSVEDALKVFARMPELRVKADSASYSTLIQGLCRSGEFKRAEELVDELLEKEVLVKRGGCVPLIAGYNLIFEYLCQNGKAEKAGRLFRELLERRGIVDVAAFKTLILGHCKEGALREGYELLVLMVRRDLVPDVETCEALIEGFLGKGKMGLAWKALEKMLGCGHRPSTSTFHSVLAGLLKEDVCAKEAGNLVAVMLERRIRPNIDLSTDLLAALFRNGLNDRASEIAGLLYHNGYCVKIEKLVEVLCQDQKFLKAQELLLFSLEKHQNLDAKLYEMVLNGLCETGRSSEAFGLFYELAEKGNVHVIYSCLNDLKLALEAAGRLKEAEFVSKQRSRTSTGRAVNSI